MNGCRNNSVLCTAVAAFGVLACGDDLDVCPGVTIEIDTAGSPEGEYWVREVTEQVWRSVAVSRTSATRVCVRDDYAFVERCGGFDSEWRRTLEDDGLRVSYCGGERPTPTPRILTVEMNQPGQVDVLRQGRSQPSLNWQASFDLAPATYDVVAISRYGDYLREAVTMSEDRTVVMDFARAAPLGLVTFVTAAPEADETALGDVVMTTSRGTFLFVDGPTRDPLRRMPTAALEPGDVQAGGLTLYGDGAARGARFALTSDAPVETFSMPPRLVGHAALVEAPLGVVWPVGDPAFAEADEVQLGGRTGDVPSLRVRATRRWLDAYAPTGLSFDPTAPGGDLPAFETVDVRTEFVEPGAERFSRLDLRSPN